VNLLFSYLFNPAMLKYCFVFLLFFYSDISAQNCGVYKLNSQLNSSWVKLDSCWKFQVGDNPDWAKREVNDSSWTPIRLFQDLNELPEIPKTDGIIWFRLRLSKDSLLNQLVMRIYQTGSSEIYLNGKRIHQLGVVSTNPDLVEYYNPRIRSLSLPLSNNSENVLAIRWTNKHYFYAKYYDYWRSFLTVWVSTNDYAAEDNMVKNQQLFNNRIHIVIGVLSILGILYLAFYFFFRVQKVNLYFSIACFVFTAAIDILYKSFNSYARIFWYDAFSSTLSVVYVLLSIYCIYLMFNQKVGWIFKTMLVLGIITIPVLLFISETGFYIFICLGLIESIRINLIALKNKKEGAWIVFVGFALSLLFWILVLLTSTFVLELPTLYTYIPLAFLITPISQAIYLGYTFGITSQSLRQKLQEVETLSAEKQQILSEHNITLEKQVLERTSELNQSLLNLKSTQSQLIQSEKMASLGELTAGIAHEIQNPLNFVNNFSEVNKELIDELQQEIKTGKIDEAISISNDIKENEEKINHHGKRADAIVKGMLQHSRSSYSQKEPTDINALADEYLRLAYHGLRAKDKSLSAGQAGFNATLKTDYDESLSADEAGIGKINIIPQDIGRVILNLITNAFYATNEKKKLVLKNYDPTVTIKTLKIPLSEGRGAEVFITVKDNGNGIPPKVLDKIFQPFFTTKPTGQGTGLGLSLAYDIVIAHGGELKVETKEGEGSEFIIKLPV